MYTGGSVYFDHSYAKELANLVTPNAISPLRQSELTVVNQDLIQELGMDPVLFEPEAFFDALYQKNGMFNKNAVAQKYGGHQFGSWNPELGDGRGLLLAEWVKDDSTRVDLHLKGAGQTPYSRFGDGRAVLRSTIREYLASEALHALGVPTSRALCLINSEEKVLREQPETGAMLIRTCPSHLRFGHYEYFFHSGQTEQLDQLFNYTFKYHFPQFLEVNNPHLELLKDVVESTASMIAKWQAFGFNHGVMNTDNMSIHGITFDYGPYAFLDEFQPDYICNHSDHSGRYAFDQQPSVGLWNLNALAHSFTPYLSVDDIKTVLELYEPNLLNEYSSLIRGKLGLTINAEGDQSLVNGWLDLLVTDKRDYSISFRLLADYDEQDDDHIINHFISRERARSWLQQYKQRIQQEPTTYLERKQAMQSRSPKFVLRNYLAQNAIDKAQQGDFSVFTNLLNVLANPFEAQPENEAYAKSPPDWGKSMEISCSS